MNKWVFWRYSKLNLGNLFFVLKRCLSAIALAFFDKNQKKNVILIGKNVKIGILMLFRFFYIFLIARSLDFIF